MRTFAALALAASALIFSGCPAYKAPVRNFHHERTATIPSDYFEARAEPVTVTYKSEYGKTDIDGFRVYVKVSNCLKDLVQPPHMCDGNFDSTDKVPFFARSMGVTFRNTEEQVHITREFYDTVANRLLEKLKEERPEIYRLLKIKMIRASANTQ
jgi:hypothetical protein